MISFLLHVVTRYAVALSFGALLLQPEGRGFFFPDEVIGIFHCLTSSGLTMSLGLTQSLTEMSTGGILLRVKAAGA